MKHLKLFFALFAMLALGVGNAWAETETLASWTFTSSSYPKNKTNFSATGGTCKTGSTFYLNGSGSTWNTSAGKGYAFTAVTDITITLKLANPISAGTEITFAADMFYNKATNAPMKGFNVAVSSNGGTYVTTGLNVTSISLSNSSQNKAVVYTAQSDLEKDATIAIKYTQTGKAGAGQGYFNNITITAEQSLPVELYTVSYDSNGGSGTMSSSTGSSITILDCSFTAPNGKKISKWNTEDDGSGTSYNPGAVVTEDLTLFAIWEDLPEYTVTLKDDESTLQQTTAGEVVVLPSREGCDGYTFAGWTASWTAPQTAWITTAPTIIAAGEYTPTANVNLYPVYTQTEEGVSSTTQIVDQLTHSINGKAETNTNYTAFSNKTYSSDAIYAGSTSNGTNNDLQAKGVIQIRSNNSNTGIITTTSGGLVKKVVVVWHSYTSSGRTLDVYGKRSAYSSVGELYDNSTQGTKIGSIVCGTSTELTITDDYEFIGLRSKDGAMYLKSISITWETTTGGPTTSYISVPDCSTPAPAVLVSIAKTAGKTEFTEGDAFEKATITATYDDETTKDVTSLATFTGYDMNTTGTQTVTVTYEGQTTTYQITVNAKTPATLTLSKNGVEEAFEGEHKVGDVVTLPSITSDCVKQFVGWSADANCATTPEYAPGADFTFTAEEHTLYAVYATAAEGELTSIFSETFDACDGTGGNDGEWSGTVAQGDLPDELSSTWTFIKGTKAKECAKFGTSSVKGSAETPAITLTGSAMLTFKSAAWDGSKEQTTLNVSATGATLSQTSVTLDKGSWNAYTIGITEATGSVKIKFEAVVDDNNRFFLDDVVVSQASVTYSDYSTTCAVAPDAPVFSVGTGTYNAAQTVTITAEDGATIYYTLDGNKPTNESDVYSSALTISETTTLKAIAVKDGLSSAITTATYTIKLPLTTIDQIFAKATEVGGTATAVEITMGDWTVSGANDKNVFVTDGTKGFIIYKSDEGHGFVAGDVLSGTVACKVQLFKGSAELTELTSTTSGLTVTPGGTVTPVTLDAAGITALTGVNTGSVIKINGTCTLEDSKYYVAGVQLYNTLYEFQTLEPSAEYNVTGVYQLYTTTKEILPRQEADIEKIESLPTATISIADITMEVEETKTITATIYPAAAADAVVYSTTSSCISISGNTITALTEGTATVTATIADSDDKYYGATKDFTVTVTPKSTKDNVVVLAKYGDQWYAMMAQYVSGKTSHLAALPVDYVDGKLYNVSEENKALIEWTRSVVDGKATFSNNSKYLTGKSDKTDLTLAATSCDWTISGESYLIGERTFFYNAENNWFRNFGTSNAGNKNYSGLPVVTAPVYVNLNTASVKTIDQSYFSVGDNKYVQFSTGNLQYEVGTNTWSFASKQYEVIGGDAYDPANPTNTNYGMNEPGYTGKLDLFGWSSDGKFGVNPSNTDAHYGYAGSDFVDWGELVNETGWYTLTKEEMNHILARTKDGKKLWALATVCGMNGLILLPDNWNTSISLDYGYVPANFNYTKNQINDATWQTLEAAGAVFLPEGGSRVGGHGNKDNATGPSLDTPGATDAHDDYFHVDNVGSMGYYWLNTQDTRDTHKNCASFLILPGWSEGPTDADNDDVAHSPQVWSREKRRGNSVRLVKAVEPVYTRNGQTSGAYGTVCYRENIVWVDGATLYEVAGKEGNKVIFDEVTTPEAGMPYIFIAEKETINFICGTEYEEGTAGKHNSLQGTFTKIEPAVDNILVDNYMLVNNIIKKCGINCGLYANRAYFVATELEGLDAPQSQMPGRRRISLNVTSENTTTGLDNITNGENTTIKVFENGQLIIIRNGEKFNVQGQKL